VILSYPLLFGSAFLAATILPFYPDSAKTIQIDVQPTQIGKRHPADIALVGQAGPTLTRLTSQVRAHRSADFLQAMQQEMQSWLAQQSEAEQSSELPIQPPRVMRALANLAAQDAIFVCDTGTVTAWTARHLRLKPGQRYTLSGGLASMAYALPGAIGAQLANPDKRVFALAGDGAFAVLLGEFATAVKYDLAMVVLVLNNAKLGFITLEQQSKGLPDYGTGLENPDFAAFARACGGVGFTVDRPDQLENAIEDALATKKPAVIDIMVDPGALIFPPKLNVSLAMNFGLAEIREAFGA
jgi:pyruvate oxidase